MLSLMYFTLRYLPFWIWNKAGIKIAKMANDYCGQPLYNNDKRYDSDKDLSYFNLPRYTY